MKVFGRCATAIVAVLTMLPAAASAAVPQKSSGLPSNACKLLTLAQVQKVLAGAADGEPIHDKADKQEICNWEVDGTADYLQVTLRPFTGDAGTAKALYGTNDPDEKVKGLGPAAAFAQNDSDYTVRAVLGKVALVVQLKRSDYDQSNSGDVAKLKADATSIATQVAKKL
jgi:hypothetical protein